MPSSKHLQALSQVEMNTTSYSRNNEVYSKNTKKEEPKNGQNLEATLNVPEEITHLNETRTNAELLVLRGLPWTGKTSAIISRIIEAVKQNQQILVITMNNFLRNKLLKWVRYVFQERGISINNKTFMYDDKYNYLLDKYKPFSGKSELEQTKEIMENILVVFAKSGSFFIERSQNGTTFHPTIALIDDVPLNDPGICPLYTTMSHVIATENSGEYPRKKVCIGTDWTRTGLTLQEKPPGVEAYSVDFKADDVDWWSSTAFCEDIYHSNMSIANNSLRNLPCIEDKNRKALEDKIYHSFVCCDTGNVKRKDLKSYYEKINQEGSYFNEGEARIAVQHVRNLLREGVQPETIAIVTPFKAQKQLVTARLKFFKVPDSVEVANSRTFSKQDKVVIIFSPVRCNPMVEFEMPHALKVLHTAITNAKCQFFYIGSSWMLSHSEMFSPFRSLYQAFRTQSIGTMVSPDMVYGGAESKCIKLSHSFGDRLKYFIETCNDDVMRKKCIRMARNFY